MFSDNLRKAGVDEPVIDLIMGVPYAKSEDRHQNAANFYAAAMDLCEKLLPGDVLAEVMLNKACCKTGFRLQNARNLAKAHGDKPLPEKLALLGQLQYMGKPSLTPFGDILAEHCAGTTRDGRLTCSCWRFGGATPENGPMPLTYCLCCAAHFRFHYQKALGLTLRVKEVVSSVFHDDSKGCSFLFEIVEKPPRKPRKARATAHPASSVQP